MDALLRAAVVLLPIGYLLVATAYGRVFFTGDERSEKIAAPALAVLLAGHLAALVLLAFRWHQFPAATISQALSLLAFAVAAVYALLERLGRDRTTGFWLVGLAFTFQFLSSLLARPTPPDFARLHDPLVSVHVALGVLGYAGFAVAAAYGFLFLQLYRELKGRRFSTFFGKLPPLEVLERMMNGALVAGWLALTGAVAAGLFSAERLVEGAWQSDPKILATLATWALYGLALALRRLRRWQARQTAIVSLAGLAAILFSIVAVNLFLTAFHGFR